VVTISRKNGCKGLISCKFKTVDLEDKENKAVPGEDFEEVEGVLTFKNSETAQFIRIKLLNKR